MNTAAGGNAPTSTEEAIRQREDVDAPGVWAPPRGGMKRGLISKMIRMVVGKDGVAEEVLDGLEAVELG